MMAIIVISIDDVEVDKSEEGSVTKYSAKQISVASNCIWTKSAKNEANVHSSVGHPVMTIFYVKSLEELKDFTGIKLLRTEKSTGEAKDFCSLIRTPMMTTRKVHGKAWRRF